MGNLYYRNTNAQISFEVFDSTNTLVGLSTYATIYWYIKTPDNLILSNDPNISTHTFNGGTGIYTTSPIVQNSSTGIYYIDYVVTKVGEYKYKFQVIDDVILVNASISGDIKVIDDGIF